MSLTLELTGRQIEALWSVLYTSEYWAVAHGTNKSPRNLAVRKVTKVLGPLMDVVPGDQAVTFDLAPGELELVEDAIWEVLADARRSQRWEARVHDAARELWGMIKVMVLDPKAQEGGSL